mgnify:FL=1
MKDADIDLVTLAVTTPFQLFGQWAFLLWDAKRLPAATKKRAWPDATLGSAVYFLGPLATGIHVAMTRRGLHRLQALPYLVAVTFGYFALNVLVAEIASYF